MSVVVLIDGSPEAALASSLAISLAKTLNDDLIAQAVIDRNRVMDLTGYKGQPGLCGSGLFIGAYEEIVKILVSVQETLLTAFTANAEGYGVSVKTSIEVGDAAIALDEIVGGNEGDYVLVLPGSDSMLAHFESHNFACPTLIVTGKQARTAEVDIIAPYEWQHVLKCIVNEAMPDLPVMMAA